MAGAPEDGAPVSGGDAPPPFRQRRFTSQSGLRLAWRDYARPGACRPAVLCLPGLTRNSRDFARIAEHLAPRHRVVVLDYRGRGRSERAKRARDYDPRSDLEDVRHLLTLAGLHRVVAIGTSYGGILAMALGAMVPGALAGVVLNDIGPRLGETGIAAIKALLPRIRRHADWASAAAQLRELMPDLSLQTEAEWQDFARATFRRAADGTLEPDWDPALIKPTFGRGAATDLWPYFHALARLPVLAIRGGRSEVLDAPTLAEMEDRHPNLTAVTLPGIGHAPSLYEPACKHAIDTFLRPLSHG